MRILITGAGGYLGHLFIGRFLAHEGVEQIIATDAEPPTHQHPRKVFWVRGMLDDKKFTASLGKYGSIDVVIHTAFIVRSGYGKRAKEVEHINLQSCENVFRFCFENKVKKLVYLSSAAVYGAQVSTMGQLLQEDQALEGTTYPYGAQKRKTEQILQGMYQKARPKTRVIVVRACGVNAPKLWKTQIIHERDLLEGLEFLTFKPMPQSYEVFNLAPPYTETEKSGPLRIPGWLLRIMFSFLWHASGGKILTPPGLAHYYIYPVVLDGTKITNLGFRYRYSPKASL